MAKAEKEVNVMEEEFWGKILGDQGFMVETKEKKIEVYETND